MQQSGSLETKPAGKFFWHDGRRRDRLERLFLSLIILAILYGTVVTTLANIPACLGENNQPFFYFHDTGDYATGHTKITGFCLRLPFCKSLEFDMPEPIYVLFNAGGVFDCYGESNYDYAIFGLPVGADAKVPWVDLHFVDQVYPHSCVGPVTLRFGNQWHDLFGPQAHDAAMAFMARRIRLMWNREHPDNLMCKVALYELSWPRSDLGYDYLRTPKTEKSRLMYAEP